MSARTKQRACVYAFLAADLRAVAFRCLFRIRMASGVTSMSSSAPTYEMASSSVKSLGGVSRMFSSVFCVRMFVRAFFAVGFAGSSVSRLCSL